MLRKKSNSRIYIPKSLQGVLWSVNVRKLDPEEDREYIIHQVLMYGTLQQIRWLLDAYGKAAVRQVFLGAPSRIYSRSYFYLVKDIILGLKNKWLSEKQYVSDIF